MEANGVYFTCKSCQNVLFEDYKQIGTSIKCSHCNKIQKVPNKAIIPGLQLDDFKTLKLLGSGGMGEVWLAQQTSLNRKVALKILSLEESENPDYIKRFLQETQIAAKLNHPNIVTTLQAGESNGIRYLAINYVNGKDIAKILEESGDISEQESLIIVREIAKALKYAWDNFTMLHRDIKPDNIMMDKAGVPKLMDMGIAKLSNSDFSLTLTGEIVGTPYYISPEQARGSKDLDSRADQYSLGVTLFEMITNKKPFTADSPLGVLTKHIEMPIPDCKKTNPNISDNCKKIIEKMMRLSH